MTYKGKNMQLRKLTQRLHQIFLNEQVLLLVNKSLLIKFNVNQIINY